MRLVTITCPHCGANITVDMDNAYPKCDYCGTTVVIDRSSLDVHEEPKSRESIQKSYSAEQEVQPSKPHVNPIVLGYPEQNSNYRDNKYAYEQTEQPQTVKRRRTWLWVLGWIFIFPVPLTIILLRKKDMNPILKYAIIAFVWLLYLAIGSSGSSASGRTMATVPGYAVLQDMDYQAEMYNVKDEMCERIRFSDVMLIFCGPAEYEKTLEYYLDGLSFDDSLYFAAIPADSGVGYKGSAAV